MLLEIDNMTVRYGKLTAVHDVSLRVPEGAVVRIELEARRRPSEG